jgi:hypothetical protein
MRVRTLEAFEVALHREVRLRALQRCRRNPVLEIVEMNCEL